MGDSEELLDMPSLPATRGGFNTPRKLKRKFDGEPREFSAEAKISDTPLNLSQRTANDLANEDLEEPIMAVMLEVPKYVPEVPVDKFVKHFLPNISKVDEHLDSICEEVEKERAFVDNDWADLGISMNEEDFFKGYRILENRVISIAESFLGENSKVLHISDGHSVSESIYPGSIKNGADGTTDLRRVTVALLPWRYCSFHSSAEKVLKRNTMWV